MKKAIIAIVGIFVFVLTSQLTLGLGISPGKTRVNFEPGLNRNYTFKILNDGRLEGVVAAGVSGELADYITIYGNSFRFAPNQSQQALRFNLRLPKSFIVGKHEGRITVTQKSMLAGIGAQLSLAHRVILTVPPKYGRVVASINGTPGLLVVGLTNPKDTKVVINFSIRLSEDGKGLFNYAKRGIPISANTTTQLKVPLNFTRKGLFELAYTIEYSQGVITHSLPISLGKPIPGITLANNTILAGQISRLNITVKNDWNQNFKARIKAFLYKDKRQVWNSVSQGFLMPSYSSTVTPVFIDATKLKVGAYNLTLELWWGKNKATLKTPLMLVAPVVKIGERNYPWKLLIASALLILVLAIGIIILRSKYI